MLIYFHSPYLFPFLSPSSLPLLSILLPPLPPLSLLLPPLPPLSLISLLPPLSLDPLPSLL